MSAGPSSAPSSGRLLLPSASPVRSSSRALTDLLYLGGGERTGLGVTEGKGFPCCEKRPRSERSPCSSRSAWGLGLPPRERQRRIPLRAGLERREAGGRSQHFLLLLSPSWGASSWHFWGRRPRPGPRSRPGRRSRGGQAWRSAPSEMTDLTNSCPQ